jgi:hypothetical protein
MIHPESDPLSSTVKRVIEMHAPAFLKLFWNWAFQNLFPSLERPVDINDTVITGIITTGFLRLPGFKTGSVGVFIGGAILFGVTVENIPAGSQLHQPSEARQSESLVVNQVGNLPYLSDVKIRIYAIIGLGFTSRFHQAHLFVLAYGLLGEIYFSGNSTDEISRRFFLKSAFFLFAVQISPQTISKNDSRDPEFLFQACFNGFQKLIRFGRFLDVSCGFRYFFPFIFIQDFLGMEKCFPGKG